MIRNQILFTLGMGLAGGLAGFIGASSWGGLTKEEKKRQVRITTAIVFVVGVLFALLVGYPP